MAKQTEKQLETLTELKDAFDSIVEPDIEAMFRNVRRSKTLDDFKEAVAEISEFVECLHADLEDLQGAIDDSEYDDDCEPTDSDAGGCE